MVKGTPSRGKHMSTQTILCRRCGRRSYHITKHRCSACGFGESTRIRQYSWQTKTLNRERRLL